jgi:hypothetical protein
MDIKTIDDKDEVYDLFKTILFKQLGPILLEKPDGRQSKLLRDFPSLDSSEYIKSTLYLYLPLSEPESYTQMSEKEVEKFINKSYENTQILKATKINPNTSVDFYNIFRPSIKPHLLEFYSEFFIHILDENNKDEKPFYDFYKYKTIIPEMRNSLNTYNHRRHIYKKIFIYPFLDYTSRYKIQKDAFNKMINDKNRSESLYIYAPSDLTDDEFRLVKFNNKTNDEEVVVDIIDGENYKSNENDGNTRIKYKNLSNWLSFKKGKDQFEDKQDQSNDYKNQIILKKSNYDKKYNLYKLSEDYPEEKIIIDYFKNRENNNSEMNTVGRKKRRNKKNITRKNKRKTRKSRKSRKNRK